MINEDILLSRGAVYKKVKKGEFIFHEGSKCSFYFQLINLNLTKFKTVLSFFLKIFSFIWIKIIN